MPEKDICLACAHVLHSAICEERITEFWKIGQGRIQKILLEFVNSMYPWILTMKELGDKDSF